MHLEDMRPGALRIYLKAQGRQRWLTCDELRSAISDWLFDEDQSHGPAIKSLGSVEAPSNIEQAEEYEEANVWSPEFEGWI